MTTEPSFKPASLRIRLILLKGVLRRFLLYVFCRNYVTRSIAARKGECARCGVCCHLVANRCASLKCQPDGSSLCRIYNYYRLPNCRIFPIDARDIADRDRVAPAEVPCGYRF